MARRPRQRWNGSRYENESGCRISLRLEPILDELGNGIDATFSQAYSTFSQAYCLLGHAGCHALHASDR